MIPLRDHMDRVYRGIAAAGLTLVALDFDGTLSDIVPRPEDAVLTPARRELLRELNALPRFAVAVISGRTLDELRERVGLDDIAYAGHHGLEIAGPGFHHTPPEAEAFRSVAAALGAQIQATAGATPGVILEHKGLSLSVHYRLAPKERRAFVLRAIRRAAAPLLAQGAARVVRGKEVINFLPPIEWHKGTALRWLMARLDATANPGVRLDTTAHGAGVFPIYIGDDVTDEDAFPVARETGIAARVGPPKPTSAANYSLPTPAEVESTLRAILTHARTVA